MLDILHNGVTKKVNAAQEENAGLLIISGIPYWDYSDSTGEGTYTAIFINPKITRDHTIKSVKIIQHGVIDVSNWVNAVNVRNGYLEIASTNSNIVGTTVICELYDTFNYMDNFGIYKHFENVPVNFSNWEIQGEDDPTSWGVVTISIQDESIKQLIGSPLLPDTFDISSDSFIGADEARLRIPGVVEVKDNNDLVCDFVCENVTEFISSITDGEISFLCRARNGFLKDILKTDVEWSPAMSPDGTIYTTSFIPEIPHDFYMASLVAVYGENGEEFPVVDRLMPGHIPEKFCTFNPIQGIRVSWLRDTEPELTKLIAKVNLTNYSN